MWSIQRIGTDGGNSFHFLVGEEYIVGRKDCPILISGDQSISRKHASFKVKHPESNLNRLAAVSALILKETSKFGSTYNGAELENGSETSLQNQDTISFGKFGSNKWRVSFEPLVVAASALPADAKRSLKQTVHKIGGHVVSEWCPQCTHLVMSQLNVTIKVISALVAGRPIVIPDFFKHTLESVKEKSSLPTPGTYLPTVAEAAINKNEVSFGPNERRKELFKDRTFFFLTEKQYKRLHIPISVAGGRSELLDEDSNIASISDRLTCSTSCVLYTEHQDSSQQMSQTGQQVVTQVLKLLKKNNLRPIPESELGLAVIYVSTALHCNPKVAQAGLDLLSAVPSQSLPTQNVLALDTQSNTQQIHGGSRKQDRKTTATTSKETGSASNLPKQKLASTPKISKISETIIATPTNQVSSSSSSRLMEASPEFSLQEKAAPIQMETLQSGDEVKRIEKDGGQGARKDKRRKEEMGGKDERIEEQQVIRIKEEILSQPDARRDSADKTKGDGVEMDRRDNDGAKVAPAGESIEIKSEQPSRTGTSRNTESGSKPKQRQGTLDLFRKPSPRTDKADRRIREETRVEGESRQVDDASEMKEEPMDQAETEVKSVIEQEDEDEEVEEVEEEDPFHYERKKPKKKPDVKQTNVRDKSNGDGQMGGGKGSSKRRGNWSDENDEESKNRGQTSTESMWKKKARIDVFSQEEEAEAESQSQEDEEEQGSGRAFSEDAFNLPRGFVSARIPIEDQVNVKIEQDYMKEDGLPSKLIKVMNAALIVRKKRNPPRRNVKEAGNRRQVKNFKKFRKAGYAGQAAIPRIIGGSDLFTHHNNPSKDIEDMFNEEVRAEKKKDKQEEMAEKLFAFEPRRAPISKRKR